MKKTEYDEIQANILAFRKDHFQVKVEPSKYSPGEVAINVTYNGFQWNTLTFLPHEFQLVLSAMQSYRP